MLHEQTQRHIEGLGDAELLEYILMGERLYEQEAIEYARTELYRRRVDEETLASLRPAIIEKIAAFDARGKIEKSVPSNAGGILCQRCGCEAPNRYVEYYQNIGLFVVRFRRKYGGQLCKACNRGYFWKATLTTLVLGWWGVISMFLAVTFLIHNILAFVGTISLPAGPANAERPRIDERVLAAVGPHVEEIVEQLHAGADAADISRAIAGKTTATPGQVWCFIQTMVRNQAAGPEGIDSHVTSPDGGAPS